MDWYLLCLAVKEPQLYDFRRIENRKTKRAVQIINEVQAQWETVADLFQLPPPTVNNLRDLTRENACRTVFDKWLKGEGEDGPRDWHAVIVMIENIPEKKLASDIRAVLTGQ